ncbi:TPA: CBS domain-containing protein [Candidatus Micrarchaeota archaeon]|nr:CBS domain-containing protein [Candidatus Micrarchaeota archaeon]
MFPDVSEIGILRRKAGLSQAVLAREAGVSQSLVAKIESGRIEPGYAVVSRIFGVLANVGKKDEKTAGEVMNRKVLWLLVGDSLRQAVTKMKSNAISQVPVLEDDKPVGLVTEGVLLDALSRGSKQNVGEVMAEAPSVVSLSTPLGALAGLLKHCSLVLVAEKGRFKGVVTKSDLFDAMY